MSVIVTVLKSGGDFLPEHVQSFHAQLNGLDAVCLSDVPVSNVSVIPLRYNWPGWFSKMELFNPEIICDDILYFDLDTLLIHNPTVFLHDDCLRMLSDFYHPERPASGMMYIPHKEKLNIWSRWVTRSERWISECRGDQDVLEKICGRDVARFGSQVKSYKVHVAAKGMSGWNPARSIGDGSIPPDTQVLCFHGNPRPWDITISL